MLTLDFISQYFVEKPPTHEFYAKSVSIHERLEIHSYGSKPDILLDKARPNEDDIYKQWRKERYTPITKTYWGKIVTTSSKVRKAEDWAIKFKEDIKGGVPKDESLEKYVNENYPYFDSFDNWFFTLAFKKMFDDPNQVVAILPLPKKDPTDDTEYYRPFTYLYESERVIDFKDNNYCVLISDEKSIIKVNGEPRKEGRVYIFIDRDSYVKAEQVGEREEWNFQVASDQNGNMVVIKHDIGYLPAFRIGGNICEFENNEMLYDSFIEGCVNYFEEAIMDYSDHQVNKAIHLHPDRWEIADVPCRTCDGKGTVNRTFDGKPFSETCGVCHGNGKNSVKTPMGVKLILPSIKNGVTDSTSIPTPPMGYANRPIESLEFLKREIDSDIRNGLSAVNMEFLMDEPQENSGISKAMDRDGLSVYYYTLGKHIIENIYTTSYYLISKWRYKISEQDIMYNMPSLKVPEKYDVIISSMLADRAEKAKTAGMDTAIINGLQVAYARKEFGDTSNVPLMMETIYLFDPMSGKSEEEKMVILSNRGCTKEDYILSSNIFHFTKRAMVEVENFLLLDYTKKKAQYEKYTKEVVNNQPQIVPVDAGVQ